MLSVWIVSNGLCEHSYNNPAKEPGNLCATNSDGFVTINVDTYHDDEKGYSHGYSQGIRPRGGH